MNRIDPSGSSSCGLQRVRQPPMPPPLTIQADPAPVAQTFFVDEEIQALILTLALTLIFFADDETQALYLLWRIYLLWTMRYRRFTRSTASSRSSTPSTSSRASTMRSPRASRTRPSSRPLYYIRLQAIYTRLQPHTKEAVEPAAIPPDVLGAPCVYDSTHLNATQVAFADRILLNKTDLVTEAELAPIEERLLSGSRR